MYFRYNVFWLMFVVFCFSSCRHFQPTEDNPFAIDNEQVGSSAVFIKKLWIRETFLKDFLRPSILQPISPVFTSSGLLIQGNKANGVSAYTLDKGKKQWFFPVKGGLAGGVLVSDDFVFFGSSDGFIYSLHLNTGKILWKHYVGLTSISKPVVRKKYLYFASPNKIYCLNKKTGENVWTYSTQVKTAEFTVEGVASPLIGSSFIYFKVSDGSLVALDFTGRLKWKLELSNSGSRFTSASSSPVMGKLCLYSASLESGLYCLNKKTGKIIWKTAVGSHGNLLLSGSNLFYPSNDGNIIALDQKSGKQIWIHKVPQSIATSLVLYKDILIYGEYSGALRFISKSTGKGLGFFAFGSGMSAPPIVSAINSQLYFISNFGWLYKLKLHEKQVKTTQKSLL